MFWLVLEPPLLDAVKFILPPALKNADCLCAALEKVIVQSCVTLVLHADVLLLVSLFSVDKWDASAVNLAL